MVEKPTTAACLETERKTDGVVGKYPRPLVLPDSGSTDVDCDDHPQHSNMKFSGPAFDSLLL